MRGPVDRWRIIIFGVICLVFMTLLLVRLFDIQYRQGPRLRRLALQAHVKKVIIDRQRGTMTDGNGRVLAVSMKVPSCFVDPSQIKNPDEVAALLTPHIRGVSPEKLKKALNKKSLFAWIERKMETKRAAAIKALKIKGVYFQKEYKRYYPRESMAANLLGFVGMDDKGLEGIEYFYDKIMKCDSGYAMYKGDVRGYEIPESNREEKPPEGGFDLVLSIDEVIQHIVEEEVGNVYRKYKAESAMGIVMDPHTGEILAMANFPSYNLNSFANTKASTRRNRVITDMFEPGSTFKLIMASAAEEMGLVNSIDRFECDGKIRIGGFTIRCHASHGIQTFTQVIANSCNEGTVEMAKKIGKKRFYEYIRRFGFGKKTGIALPGEVPGRIMSYKRWADIDLGAIGMGQAVGITALQMVSAVSAIMNGGQLVKPRVVLAIADPETGRVVKRFPKELRQQAISPETAAKVIEIMKEVVVSGTGRRAAMKNYVLAGKTGTAQKIDRETGKYSSKKVISSFIGGGPFPDPRFTIMVVMDEPKDKRASTGVVAVEPFKRIAERCLNYLSVPPTVAEESDDVKAAGVAQAQADEDVGRQFMVLVPRFLGMGKAKVESIARQNDMNIDLGGDGPVVIYQSPKPETPILPESRIVVYLGYSYSTPVSLSNRMMPCLVGKTMMESGEELSPYPVLVRFMGSGLAYAQDPVPGTPLETGAEVKVFFAAD